MRLRMVLVLLIVTGALLSGVHFLAQDSQIPLRIRVTGETRLAVNDFVPRGASNPETDTALRVFNEVLARDLEFSAFFQLVSKSFFPLKTIRIPQDVEFENWQTPRVNADFLVFGNMQIDGGAVVVEAYLYDVKTRQQVLGKRYTVTAGTLVRNVAHSFADEAVYQLSAGTSRGVARTQIAFTSLKGGNKEIYQMDYDGANIRTITANGGLNKFPAWTHDNSKLTFVTNLPNSSRWELWVQDLRGGRSVVRAPSSFMSSPAPGPDGRRLAFTSRSEHSVDSDVFLSNMDGTGLRNLTSHRSIDTSPCWSPTGQQIAFISDRSGSPQLWVMEADGTNVRRLVSEGGHCDSPNWSPDGRLIAYSWQAPRQWKHDIFVVEVASGRIYQLTSGPGDHESPHWSPDGRHLAFQSTRTGSKQIFIMNADGKNLRQVTTYGINESPAWSGYMATEQ
jgi:TolB protein